MTENVLEKKFKLLVTIVDRDIGEEVVEHNRKFHASLGAIAKGYARYPEDVLVDLFLNEQDVDIVFSLVRDNVADEALGSINEKFELDAKENGYAFTIPIYEIGGLRQLMEYAAQKAAAKK